MPLFHSAIGPPKTPRNANNYRKIRWIQCSGRCIPWCWTEVEWLGIRALLICTHRWWPFLHAQQEVKQNVHSSSFFCIDTRTSMESHCPPFDLGSKRTLALMCAAERPALIPLHWNSRHLYEMTHFWHICAPMAFPTRMLQSYGWSVPMAKHWQRWWQYVRANWGAFPIWLFGHGMSKRFSG